MVFAILSANATTTTTTVAADDDVVVIEDEDGGDVATLPAHRSTQQLEAQSSASSGSQLSSSGATVASQLSSNSSLDATRSVRSALQPFSFTVILLII